MKIKSFRKLTRCPVCRNDRFLDIGPSRCPILTEDFRIEKCSSCGLVFVNPSPNQKELSKVYTYEYRLGENSWLTKLLSFYLLGEFRKDANFISCWIDGGKVLDIGYGSGEMLVSLKGNWDKYGFDPYSTEYDRKMVEKKLKIKAIKTLKDVKRNSLDLVILRNVIEHTMAFSGLLDHAYELLKPGGLLFVRTPNIESLDFKIFKHNWYVTYMGGHIIFFSKRTLIEVAKSSGFRPKIVKPVIFSSPLSFKRSLELILSMNNKFVSLALSPVSLLYSLVSGLFQNGGDLVAILQK